ncbi:MAG TPA: VOC family protein [Solirubrobacteraceae bacterium]|nr:VOC family protein [Solirubrobacteraceae bacterium]
MSIVTGVDFAVVWVKDFDAAIEFYGTTLGLPEGQRYGQMPGQEFETGNLTLAIMEAKAFGQEFEPSKHPFALQVGDIAAVREQLEGQGVTFHTDTFDSGVCHQAVFSDPDGNMLILHERYAPR